MFVGIFLASSSPVSASLDVSFKDNVLYVDNDWVGGSSVPQGLSYGDNAFASIENAIGHADARENNRIEVCPGKYGNSIENFPITVDVENLIITSKEGPKLTIVNSENIVRDVYEIRNDNIGLNGFKILGAENATGILIYNSEGVKIENNISESNGNGIFLISSSNNLVENNIAEYNTRKGIIFLDSSENNTVRNNLAVNNGHSGFYLGKGCTGNMLENNTAKNNWDGFSLGYTSWNILRNNLAENNGVDGFRIKGSDNNILSNNVAENNRYRGFHIHDNSSGNLLENNYAENNKWLGISVGGWVTVDDNSQWGVINSHYNVIKNNICNCLAF